MQLVRSPRFVVWTTLGHGSLAECWCFAAVHYLWASSSGYISHDGWRPASNKLLNKRQSVARARTDFRCVGAEVRDAVGHSNVSITSAYLHVVVDDEQGLGSLFEFAQ